MHREPSIHIYRSDLLKIFKDILPKGVLIEAFTDQVMLKARPYSLNNRVVVASTDRIENRLKRTLSASTADADLLARIIALVRKRLKHKGVTQIKPSDRDWPQVKVIAELANQFSTDFELPKKAAYIKYIEIAFSKMNRPLLQKVPAMHSSICETYEAMEVIRLDTHPDITEKVHNYYRLKVAGRTGFVNNFKNAPEKYMYFVKVRELVDSLRVPLNHFINAQFEAFEYKNGLPQPSQLIGPKAKERLNKYLFEHNITVKDL